VAGLIGGARRFGRRRRGLITVVVSLATAAVLVLLIAGRRDEFVTALSAAAASVLALTVLLQIVALVARSEAWHLTIGAAGGTVDRRVLYRASSMQVLGSVVNGNLGVAARIAALRRSSPAMSPQVPTLIAAEFPILAVEAMLAALASFTLVGPLGPQRREPAAPTPGRLPAFDVECSLGGTLPLGVPIREIRPI
jgi:uncharacterized membrane protein YbhN (UPF0104 family)